MMGEIGGAAPLTIIGNEDTIGRFAVVEDGKVAAVINWDGEQELPAEMVLVPVPDDAGVGWDYVDGEFQDNRPVGYQDGDVWVEQVDEPEA